MCFVALRHAVYDGTLLGLVQTFPSLGGDDHDIGHHLVLGVGVALADFTVAVLHQNCLVVLCAVDLGVVESRIHPAVDHLHRLCAEVLYHLAHQIRLLHPEGQPHEVCQRLHLFAGVEAADPGVEPRQPHKVHRAEAGEEPIPDLAVQHPPHLGRIGIEKRKLQYAQGRLILGQLAQRDAGKVDAAVLHLLDDALLGPQPASAVDDDLDPPLRPLGHKVGEGQRGLRGGVILGLVLGIAQDKLRTGIFLGSAAAHSAQCRAGGQRQHTAAGNHPPAHSPASGSAFAFWPA